MDQLIVVVIFAVIGIFNWVIRQAGKGENRDKGSPPFTPQRPRRLQPRETAGSESDEERMRKFLEALGVPPNAEPPRKIVRPLQQPAPEIQAPVARETPRPAAVPRTYVPPMPVPPIPTPQAPRPEPAGPIYKAAALSPERADPSAGFAAATGAAVSPIAVSSFAGARPSNLAGLQSLLKSPSSIRAAIILREVLGPPKGLQPPAGTAGLL